MPYITISVLLKSSPGLIFAGAYIRYFTVVSKILNTELALALSLNFAVSCGLLHNLKQCRVRSRIVIMAMIVTVHCRGPNREIEK